MTNGCADGFQSTLGLPRGWAETKGGGVTVAICDTGLYPTLRDGVRYRQFHEGGMYHGSAVLSIIRSVAPLSQIAFAAGCPGTDEGLCEMVDWLLDGKPDVLNLSLACRRRIERLERTLRRAAGDGVMVVASYSTAFRFPSCLGFVVSAGDEFKANKGVSVFAADGRRMTLSGTSAMAAVCSGCCALARSFDKAMTKERFLEETAKGKMNTGVPTQVNMKIGN